MPLVVSRRPSLGRGLRARPRSSSTPATRPPWPRPSAGSLDERRLRGPTSRARGLALAARHSWARTASLTRAGPRRSRGRALSGPFQGGAAPAQVAVVIVSFNTRDELLRCLAEPRRRPDPAGGRGGGQRERRRLGRGRPSRVSAGPGPRERGQRRLSRGPTTGASGDQRAPFVLLLNSDAEVRPGTIETLLELLETRPTVGIVGPRTVGSDGAVQVSSGPDLTPLAEWRQRRLVRGVEARRPGRPRRSPLDRYSAEHEPAWVSGSCLLTRRAAPRGRGRPRRGLLPLRGGRGPLRPGRPPGYRVLFTPAAEVVHHLGRSMAQRARRGAIRVPPEPPPLLPEAPRPAAGGLAARLPRRPRSACRGPGVAGRRPEPGPRPGPCSASRSGANRARLEATFRLVAPRRSCYCAGVTWNRICGHNLRPMKIAIDARKWRDFGIGTYVRNLVRHLATLDRETTFFLFCNPADEATLRDLAANFVPVVDGSAGYGLREHVSIPWKLHRLGADLLHSPALRPAPASRPRPPS